MSPGVPRDHAIAPGAVVKLRSGGPEMTVQTLANRFDPASRMAEPGWEYAICYWFDPDQVLQEATFHIQGLVVLGASETEAAKYE